MELSRARELVSILADGVDPMTGEVLPKDHVCNQGELVRAFYLLLDATEHLQERKVPLNAGKPWTHEADRCDENGNPMNCR